MKRYILLDVVVVVVVVVVQTDTHAAPLIWKLRAVTMQSADIEAFDSAMTWK